MTRQEGETGRRTDAKGESQRQPRAGAGGASDVPSSASDQMRLKVC